MEFKNVNEANRYFRQYKPISEEDIKDVDYWMGVDHPEMGDWMLFKHIESNDSGYNISRPILALVVGHTVWDQALVLEFVEEWRAFHWNNTINDYMITEHDKKVQHIQFWTDDIIVLGQWKTKPNYKQLRKVM